MLFAKIAAGLYVIWGLLHVQAAYDAFLLGTSVDRGIVQGKTFQDAWNLLFFALFSIMVASRYNWKNSLLGYWLNLIVVSVADVGFIIFVLIPGNVAFFPGVLGPVFWVSAAISSSIAVKIEPTS
jgi:hypothetical protein